MQKIRIDDYINKIIQGDVRDILRLFPDESIDCVVTSPPYKSLKFYGDQNRVLWREDLLCNHYFDNNIDLVCRNCGCYYGELGQEPTVDIFIENLVNIFDGIKRILKPEGTCFVNIGDSYASITKSPLGKQYDPSPKSMRQVPFRFSLKMAERGWILRNTIIWERPNYQPDGALDKFASSFEYIFFFVKSSKYYFEQQYEPCETDFKTKNGRNERKMRTVWRISNKVIKGHPATFPIGLITIPIVSGSPEGGIILDPFMGSGSSAIAASQNNRNFIGIELNPDYIELAEKRIAEIQKEIE